MNVLFDTAKLAEDAGISRAQLKRLEDGIRQQYGSDEMMCELRAFRTLRAVQEGAVSIEDAIAEFGADTRAAKDVS